MHLCWNSDIILPNPFSQERSDYTNTLFKQLKIIVPMDELAEFLPKAHWKQTGQNTYFCDDPGLEAIWIKVANELPDSLKGCGLQAWKTTGHTKVVEPIGYILAVRVIDGKPRILGGPPLIPKSKPFKFQSEAIISGSLFYIVALPPPEASANQA